MYGGACALLSEGNSALSECSCGLHLFQSAARAKVLELCGWQVCRDPAALEAAVAELEAAGMPYPAHPDLLSLVGRRLAVSPIRPTWHLQACTSAPR